MRKFLFLLMLPILQSAGLATEAHAIETENGNQISLYGNLIYDAETFTTTGPIGIYSADVMPDARVTAISTEVGKANGGACYANGLYYAIEYTEKYGSIQSCKLKTYDATTWKTISEIDASQKSIATSLTYNPADQKIYGCFYDNDADKFGFGTLNTSNGNASIIKDLDFSFQAIAANYDGAIYGVNQYGDFYRIDKTTGELSLIGATGFSPKYIQDATFDYGTKNFYWFAYNDSDSGIYEVDLSTGNADLVANWATGRKEFVGVFSTTPAYSDNVPDLVSNMTAAFENGATTGSLKFTMPEISYEGNPISGTMTYKIYIDSNLLKSGSANAGASVSETITAEKGNHKISVSATNADGEGPQFFRKTYVGSDIPKAVENIVATRNGNSANISWNPVTAGENGGYFEPSKITYNVTRMPDNKTIATGIKTTNCTDDSYSGELSSFYYEVTATDGSQSSKVSQSNTIILGEALGTPYSKNFRGNSGLDLFTVIDSNRDGKTWTSASRGAQYTFNNELDADDWLITPPLKLKAGCRYKLTSTLSNAMAPYYERFEIKYGTAATAEAMTNTAVAATDLIDNDTYDPATFEGWIVPETDGDYYVGIHAISDKANLYLFCYDLEIGKAINGDAPAEVTELTATAAELGELKATIQFNVPGKNIAGNELSGTINATVVNKTTGITIATLNGIAPGSHQSVTDESAANGNNIYSVVCINDAGEGLEAEATAYVGVDQPMNPTNVKWVQDGNKAVITWEAPGNVGTSDNYVDVDKLTYTIVMDTPKSQKIAENITGLTFSDENIDTSDGQVELSYTVYANNEAGQSRGSSSTSAAFGTPYETPLRESFAEAEASWNPWLVTTVKIGGANWSIAASASDTQLVPQDADGGMLVFTANRAATRRLTSPLINMAGLQKPALKFFANANDTNSTLKIQVSTDGENWDDILTVPADETESWKEFSVDLSNYKDAPRLQIGFLGECTAKGKSIVVDNIRIRDNYDKDLAIKSADFPTEVFAGSNAKISVEVANQGNSNAESFSVAIYDGSEEIATAQATETLTTDASTSFEFSIPTMVTAKSLNLVAKVAFAGDEKPENNEYAFDIIVVESPYPSPLNLRGSHDGNNASFAWDEPGHSNVIAPITDNFESYESWSIGGIDSNTQTYEGYIGDFKVIDGDHSRTLTISGIGEYPNALSPMACTVFDITSPNNLQSQGYTTHSGNKMLCFWSNGDAKQNDDYLILPELQPGSEVSFYAKSLNNRYGLERLEILVSKAGNGKDDFETLIPEFEVPAATENGAENNFTRFSFSIPEDAKYVALHYVSKDVFALFVDDISYTPANGTPVDYELKGYNIYRDNEKINADIIESREYSDAIEPGATHSYNVTAVYAEGESSFSNTVEITYGGSAEVTTGKLLYAAGCQIIAKGFEGEEISIFTIDGRLVMRSIAEPVSRFRVSEGTYLVKAGTTAKLLIAK